MWCKCLSVLLSVILVSYIKIYIIFSLWLIIPVFLADVCIHVKFFSMNVSEESEEGVPTSKLPLSREHSHHSKAER